MEEFVSDLKCKCGCVKFTTNELDYIAYRLSENLLGKVREVPQPWISQNKAWEQYGGRAFVERLRKDRKVATRKNANRREYYVPDLAKHVTPKAVIVQNRKYTKKKKDDG